MAMDNTVWMVVVGEVAAVVHSVTIGTLAISQRSNKAVLASLHLYLVILLVPISRHCLCGRGKFDGQLLGDCAWC